MARRKQTPRGTESNFAPAAASPNVKSPPQPRQLSGKEHTNLKQHLDNSDKPFSITTLANSKKRKRTSTAVQTETDLYDERLNVQYEIKPNNNWESLKRYKKFTVGHDSIAVGEVILVKHDLSETRNISVDAQWKAKVLEVRALGPENVYLRVAWLNRPEDLDGGRKEYHGTNELIPTNQLDIIDAMTVNGRLDVYHWIEEDDETEMPGTQEFFWRQTFDAANTGTFSKLREICIDAKPQNPDKMILQCGNESCRKWMHVKCIAENAVKQTDEQQQPQPAVTKRKFTGKGTPIDSPDVSPDSKAVAMAVNKSSTTAEVFVAGRPDGPDDTPETTTRIVITDPDGVAKTEDVKCLFCKTAIE